MLNNFNGDYPAAATAYCGLVAEVTGKDGRVTRLILVDGFDSKWVRTPSSLDIITGSVRPLPSPLTFPSIFIRMERENYD